jgi:hypothetical protein
MKKVTSDKMNLRRRAALVPKLCLGTHLSSKLCFASEATELPGHWHSQTEFGNEGETGAPRNNKKS